MIEWLLETVFLENGKCPVCKRALFFTRKHLCESCINTLEAGTKSFCVRCGRSKSQDRLKICLDCLHDPPAFDRGYCGVVYGAKVKKVVHAMKFKNRPGLCRYAGEWMADLLEKRHGQSVFEGIEGIIPVPLHPHAMKARGYNQSEMISRGFVEGWRWKEGAKPDLLTDVLVRTGEGLHQREMGKQERRIHAQKIFHIKNPEKIQGLQVLVIDDVLTTGATVDACAKALLSAGAKRVDVLVFAGVES